MQRQGFSPTLGANNTTNTYPAAVLADAFSILSDNWNDSMTNKLPFASNTTVNAAMFVGIVPSNPNISGTTAAASKISCVIWKPGPASQTLTTAPSS